MVIYIVFRMTTVDSIENTNLTHKRSSVEKNISTM